jgi:hypothetical protein
MIQFLPSPILRDINFKVWVSRHNDFAQFLFACPALKPILDALRSVRFYIGDEYDEILRDVGEL